MKSTTYFEIRRKPTASLKTKQPRKQMKKLKAFFSKMGKDYQKARAEKRTIMLDRQSCATINVMEFNGNIFLSYNGVPIINTAYLNKPVTEVLDDSRTEYLDWIQKFERKDA